MCDRLSSRVKPVIASQGTKQLHQRFIAATHAQAHPTRHARARGTARHTCLGLAKQEARHDIVNDHKLGRVEIHVERRHSNFKGRHLAARVDVRVGKIGVGLRALPSRLKGGMRDQRHRLSHRRKVGGGSRANQHLQLTHPHSANQVECDVVRHPS